MIENAERIIRNLGITVHTVLDLGSRDLEQSVEFTKAFPTAKVHAFECNPHSVNNCRSKLTNFPNISLHEMCVFDYDGTIKFHPINVEKTITTWKDGNPGASSVFIANGSYDHIEKYVQDEVSVNCTRLDTWASKHGITVVDVVWADLQGAELQAFMGMGSLLDTVKVIHTELEINPMYEGQSLFKDVDPYLRMKGFTRVYGDIRAQYGTDFIYVNMNANS